MALKMRPTGLGSGFYKDNVDYTVFTGEWEVGRIYQTCGGPDSLRWFWSLTVNGPMTRSDRVATLEEAKAQFQKSWDAWKAVGQASRVSIRAPAPLGDLVASRCNAQSHAGEYHLARNQPLG
jgi:hypothetical protein